MGEDFEIDVPGDSSEFTVGAEQSLFAMPPDEPALLIPRADKTEFFVRSEDSTHLFVRRV